MSTISTQTHNLDLLKVFKIYNYCRNKESILYINNHFNSIATFQCLMYMMEKVTKNNYMVF